MLIIRLILATENRYSENCDYVFCCEGKLVTLVHLDFVIGTMVALIWYPVELSL